MPSPQPQNGNATTRGVRRALAITVVLGAIAVVVVVLPSTNATSLGFKPFDWSAVQKSLVPFFVVSILIERAIEVFVGIHREPVKQELERKADAAEQALGALEPGGGGAAKAAGHVAAAAALPSERPTSTPQGSRRAAERSATVLVQGLPQEVTARLGSRNTEAFRTNVADVIEAHIRTMPLQAQTAAAAQDMAQTATEADIGAEAAGQLAVAQAASAEWVSNTTRIANLAGGSLGIVAALAGLRMLSLLTEVGSGGLKDLPPWQLGVFNGLDVLLSAGLLGGGAAAFHTFTSLVGAFLDTSKQKASDLGSGGS